MCSRSTLGRGELWAEPGKHQNESPASNFDNLWRFWRLQESLFQGKPERKGPSRGCPLCQAGLAGCREMTVQPAPSTWISLILGTASAPGALYPPKTCQQWATGWCTRGAPSGQMLEDKLVLQRPEIIPVILFVRFLAGRSDTHIHPFHVEFWPEESDPIVLSSSCIKCWFYCQIFSGVVPNDVHAGVCNVCDQIPNERRF